LEFAKIQKSHGAAIGRNIVILNKFDHSKAIIQAISIYTGPGKMVIPGCHMIIFLFLFYQTCFNFSSTSLTTKEFV